MIQKLVLFSYEMISFSSTILSLVHHDDDKWDYHRSVKSWYQISRQWA